MADEKGNVWAWVAGVVITCAVSVTAAILTRKYKRKHNYLLAGYSGAGKTELLCALKDVGEFCISGKWKSEGAEFKRTSHADAATFADIKDSIKLFGKEIVCMDGPGNLSGGQEKRFKEFVEAAFEKPQKHTIIYVADLTKMSSVECKCNIKSELGLLSDTAADICRGKPKMAGRKLKLIVVGSHFDTFLWKSNLQDLFSGMIRPWIDGNRFDVEFLTGDLRGDKGSMEFIEKLLKKE